MTDDRLHTRRCECGALDCTAEIEVTWEEDDAVDHSGENLWIVAPGHQLLGAREAVVVSANERFSVVRAVEEWPSGLPPEPLDPGTSLDLPASKLLSLRLPRRPSRLRLGLAPSLPVGAGCLHVAVGAPGGEPVAAASIPAKFLRMLYLATLPASLHAIARPSLAFFHFLSRETGEGWNWDPT